MIKDDLELQAGLVLSDVQKGRMIYQNVTRTNRNANH
jgi:hypothetical protein